MISNLAPRVGVLLLLAAATAPSLAAEDDAPPTCNMPTGECPIPHLPPTYVAIKELPFTIPKVSDCTIHYPNGQYHGWTLRCVPFDEPPPEVSLSCYSEPGGVSCQASPEGPEITYTWILSGGLSSPLVAPWSPYLSATCSPGQIHAGVQVYVTGPSGAYGEAFVPVNCELSDHGQPMQ